MSRSYKKHSFGSYVSGGNMKLWRSQENRRLRHKAKQVINSCLDFDGLVIPDINEFGGLWSSPRDGNLFYQEAPLLNYCEVRASEIFHSQGTKRLEWYKRFYEFKNGHFNNSFCGCYTNKRGWWWKNLRK